MCAAERRGISFVADREILGGGRVFVLERNDDVGIIQELLDAFPLTLGFGGIEEYCDVLEAEGPAFLERIRRALAAMPSALTGLNPHECHQGRDGA